MKNNPAIAPLDQEIFTHMSYLLARYCYDWTNKHPDNRCSMCISAIPYGLCKIISKQVQVLLHFSCINSWIPLLVHLRLERPADLLSLVPGCARPNASAQSGRARKCAGCADVVGPDAGRGSRLLWVGGNHQVDRHGFWNKKSCDQRSRIKEFAFTVSLVFSIFKCQLFSFQFVVQQSEGATQCGLQKMRSCPWGRGKHVCNDINDINPTYQVPTTDPDQPCSCLKPEAA